MHPVADGPVEVLDFEIANTVGNPSKEEEKQDSCPKAQQSNQLVLRRWFRSGFGFRQWMRMYDLIVHAFAAFTRRVLMLAIKSSSFENSAELSCRG